MDRAGLVRLLNNWGWYLSKRTVAVLQEHLIAWHVIDGISVYLSLAYRVHHFLF